MAEPVDESRLTAMVTAFLPHVWRFLRRLGVPAADVDDAVQEVILVAAKKLDRIEVGSERAFLLSTAFHVARRMRCVRAKRGEVTDDTLTDVANPAPAPDAALDEKQSRALLDAILLRMPVDLRTVFVLFEIEELTVATIATMLDIPIGTAASRLRRAREDFESRVARLESRARFNEGADR